MSALKPITRWAEENGITRATCWRWRHDGLLKTVNIYGRHYITPEEEDRFFQRACSGEFYREPINPTNSAEVSK